EDLLRGEHDLHRVTERRDVEVPLVVQELHEVERREVARGVVQVHVLRAWVRGVDPARRRTRVPLVDRRVVLHAGIGALPRSARALFSSTALHQMKSRTSGWSAFSTTILAARRVFPPDLIVPADASAPRMNETGPEAVPPPASSSFEERIRDRLMPDPEPPL